MSPSRILRSHLIVAITLSYISGIVISHGFPQYDHHSLTLITFALLLLFSACRRITAAHLLLLPLFLQIGLYAGSEAQNPPTSLTHIFNNLNNQEEFLVVGKVKHLFSFNGEVTRFDVDPILIRTATSEYQSSHGTIRYAIKERLPSSILPGKTIAVRAKLQEPQRFMTPGSFDYPAYLANQNIYVTGYVSSLLHVVVVHNSTSFSEALRYFPELLRERINRAIDAGLSGEPAAVYKALLTGDRSAISPSTLELFKNAGVLHILAISGMHMSLLGVFLFTIFFWLLRRSEWLIFRINTKKTAAILCIAPLLFYALIAGAKAPVLRSFIMSLIVILAICSGKKHSFVPLISCAALFLLILSPGYLFSPSFQLTFSAVMAIAAAVPLIFKINGRIKDALTRKWPITAVTWVVAAMGISLAATLGTAPLLIYHFNRISLVGVAANLIIEPLICLWSLNIGFIASAVLFIFPMAADFLFDIGGIGISLAVSATSLFKAIPNSSIYLPAPSILYIYLYYLSFLPFFLKEHYPARYHLPSLLLPAVALLFLAWPPGEVTKSLTKESTIAYLDVGHGSCTFIEMPGGRRLLIDGGAISSPAFNIGERVIAPYIFRRGIGRIDDIVITHPDSDHYNGLIFILRHFKVKTLWLSQKDYDAEGWNRLLLTAAEKNVTVKIPLSNTILHQNGDASLTVLTNTSTPSAITSNDNGLVLKYRHGSFSALFPGDISAKMEEHLVTDQLDLKANLLLATHHGSSTSNSELFVDKVRPDVMVVSSGNHGTFPAPSVLERCRRHHVAVLPIKTAGTVTVTTKKGEYHIDTLLSLD
ncbi:DNA internalization-related competence protein ComEC/Rec2 [Desulfopila inferna]|uniref:DNA internalization-related competence protein ComEC/Rec2 n=1 Tax=Desulfopila inferna TaxID=468528 RepID=UPI001962C4C4|nr:DNA internalization-related competence protein ComEC/Rec2 [Desulfopila inferna]MBM9602611.1 DNA internalization-related competence protein ComEC/Rec2 [Desulfopila inferna]